MAKKSESNTKPSVAEAQLTQTSAPSQQLYAATFAKRLRDLREAKGLSKSDLAKAVWGTTTDTRGYTVARNRDRISVYEDGAQVPTPENLKAIAAALDVNPSELAPDIVTNTASANKKPAISMTIIDGHPDQAVLTVNCPVSVVLAAQIIQMIAADPVASTALK